MDNPNTHMITGDSITPCVSINPLSSVDSNKTKSKRQFISNAGRRLLKLPTWSNLPHFGKIGVALVPTTAVWALSSALHRSGKFPSNSNAQIKLLAPTLLAAYGKAVGLVGLKDLYDELNKNLGVKLTLTRTYQLLSVLGHLLTTIAELYWTPAAGLRGTFFIINCIYTASYAYMLFLTTIYNSRLEGSSRAFESSFSKNATTRQSLNLPALLVWCAFQITTGYVWINEATNGMVSKSRALATSIGSTAYTSPGLAKEAIAVVAFLLTSIGPMRSGFRTSMTSVPDISPFAGTLTMALSSILSAAALIPMWKKSSVARIYLAGHMSVIYSVFLNSYYAFKQEKTELKHRQLWKATRNIRAKL